MKPSLSLGVTVKKKVLAAVAAPEITPVVLLSVSLVGGAPC